MMPGSHNNQNSNLNDPEWCFLGEYALKGLVVDGDIRDRSEDGMLIETIRDLGIGVELIDNIERKLIEFISGAMAQLNQLRFETPITIRLFCQKKMVEDENTMNSFSQIKEKQTLKFSRKTHQPFAAVNGGWGYFLVERSGGFVPNSTVSTFNLVDLYIYKEGE